MSWIVCLGNVGGLIGNRSEVQEMSCFPQTGFLVSGLGKPEGWLSQEVTEIEDGGSPRLVAMVTGGLDGAQYALSSLKLMRS